LGVASGLQTAEHERNGKSKFDESEAIVTLLTAIAPHNGLASALSLVMLQIDLWVLWEN